MRRHLSLLLMFTGSRLLAADSLPAPAQLPRHPGTPDPLVMFDGRPVTRSEQWLKERRPELKALFQHYMYGTLPPKLNGIQFSIERVDRQFLGGKATKKEITISFRDVAEPPRIHLLLVLPNAGPAKPGGTALPRGFPVFVGPNFCGNHTLVTETNVALPAAWMPKNCPGCVAGHATDAGRGTAAEAWALGQSIDRGYAVASFYYGDVERDSPDEPDGLRAYLKRSSWEDCGAIAAWAWGLSRAVDYLVTDRDLDPRRIAAVGHSRNGKVAILAAAFDDRIALAVPLQAGCGGTAPSRGKIGESVQRINTSFPHWFNARFKEFNEEPDRLPFDQNCLIALMAPRPVLLGCAVEDTWANPAGQFEMLQSAAAVYHLLGVEGLAAKKRPAPDELVASRLGYFIRPGKHSMTKADWKVFLDYADKFMP